MCGRWYVDMMADDELAAYYEKLKNKNKIKTSGEVFPTDHIMVIANNKRLEKNVFNMKWGYSVGKNVVFNARRESLFTKDIFIDGIKERRCVIPANYYFEWQKETKKKNIIKDEKSNVIYFLGIYRFENGEPVCTIITKDASLSMMPLHPRMPLIIHGDLIDEWLSDNCDLNLFMDKTINDLKYNAVL